MAVERWLEWLTEIFYVTDGEHETNFTELAIQPSVCTASPSERFVVEYEGSSQR